MRYLIILWDGHSTPDSHRGAPMPRGSFWCVDGVQALHMARRRLMQVDDTFEVSITNGVESWCGYVRDLYRVGVETTPWLGATSTETALLALDGF